MKQNMISCLTYTMPIQLSYDVVGG